jgi:hypothetical protein
MKNKISYFNSGFTDSNYSMNDNVLTKKALILVEGEHIDSKKRKHNFSSDRIESIANNTNTLFNQGANIPLLADHDKTVRSALGNLESPVYVEVITEDNLPNKRAKHLLGKLGIFTEEIAIKSKDAIDKVANNIVNTISAGLDITTDTIREISLTPTPAILGMSLYKSYSSDAEFEDSSALTFDDLDMSDSDMQQMEEEYEGLTNKLWVLTKNIQTADEEMLNGNDPIQLQEQAIQDFIDRFMDLIGMNEEENQEEQYQDPRMQQQNQGMNPNRSFPQAQGFPQSKTFSSDAPIAAFSMSEMESINANFGFMNNIGKRIAGDTKAIGRAFKTGQKNSLAKSTNKIVSEMPTKGFRKINTLEKTKAVGSGILRAGRRTLKTKTGKIAAGVVGTGAAIGGGLAIKNRMNKNKY